MNRDRFLSLCRSTSRTTRVAIFVALCVSALIITTRSAARGILKVNEERILITLQREPAILQIPVENLTGAASVTKVRVKLIDPRDFVLAQAEFVETIQTGKSTLSLTLPFHVSKLNGEQKRNLLWTRVHYQLISDSAPATSITEGIVSLSQIAPELFDVRVASSNLVREGGKFRARVRTLHPVTLRPARDVNIAATMNLEDDNDSDVKLETSAKTDSEGYAYLNFEIPSEFPKFPHTSRPTGGQLQIIARRGALVADASGDVLVDQFAKAIITTDKPIYQPAQTLHARALVFSPSKRAMPGQQLIFKVRDPEDLVVHQATATTSRFGVASADWIIADNSRLGNYRVSFEFENNESDILGLQHVRVSRYELPNFSVKVTPDRKYYLPGQNAQVKVGGDYLFGQSVARGHVRVVREGSRDWNYREQKWDIDEGDSYEGETDRDGNFTARIKLDDDHTELGHDEYSRFKDLAYAAYFTDPTTNRTEQRRFDLRVTKQPIHVYVIKPYYAGEFDPRLPVNFYVSTSYADGSPARCNLRVTLNQDDADTSPVIRTHVVTNRYGLARISDLRLPSSWESSDTELRVEAGDSLKRKGTWEEDLDLSDDAKLIVRTNKTLYRTGDPIVVSIKARPDNEKSIVVDLGTEGSIIQSERVQLRNGRAELTLPYTPEFKDKLNISVYHDFYNDRDQVATRTILYPGEQNLRIDLKPTQASYRPGESAQVDFRVLPGKASSLESALGIVVVDRAVEERSRTDSEFGNRNANVLSGFLGTDEQLSGVTLDDLRRIDMTRPISPDLELLAEVLLNQNGVNLPSFFESDNLEVNQDRVFRSAILARIKPLSDALRRNSSLSDDSPREAAALKRLLLTNGIDVDELRDPWGQPFLYNFFVDKQSDRITLTSMGADRKPETDDDFLVDTFGWAYFRPVGQAIERAVGEYHKRTGGFIRDLNTLDTELRKANISLATLRDRWGKLYHIGFEVKRNEYVITVRSGGPDRHLEATPSYSDDFQLWSTSINYIAELKARIDTCLDHYVRSQKPFPSNERELEAALLPAGINLKSFVDPWNVRYYVTFADEVVYSDEATVEMRSRFGERRSERVQVKPTTTKLGIFHLRSNGPDRVRGTDDDFDVASLTGVISRRSASDSTPRSQKTPVGFRVSTGGGISGRVIDVNGAAVGGATVIINTDSSSQETNTNGNGKFEFRDILVGSYQITVSAAGFKKSVITEVPVRFYDVTEVTVTLEVGTVTETVTVTGGAELLQTTESRSLMDLPVGQRNSLAGKNIKLVTKSGSNQDLFTPRLREYFPETLVWQPQLTTDKTGRAQLDFKLADNITTWKMSVIGSNESGQIGIAETEIRAFQPFFAELDPPRVLTQGDRISLPVVLRNYLPKKQTVELELKPEHWFSVLDSNRRRAEIPAGEARNQTFDIQATASISEGKQRVTAIGSEFSDAIEKKVSVHPDGEERAGMSSEILESNTTLNVDLPRETIPNSARVELKVYPNLLAHVWESVEAIMQRPYGCGEQTISSSYPSLMVLRHLKKEEQESAISRRARRYVEAGYQRLLGYQTASGGFGYWSGSNPDIALTAYALRFLRDAGEVMTVDPEVLKRAATWLESTQQADGSWRVDYGNKADDDARSAMLTALVARSLASAIDAANKTRLTQALNYIEQKSEKIDEPYLIASYALAAHAVGDTKRAEGATTRLLSLSSTAPNGVYWALETNTPFYGWGRAGQVETTALVLQALAQIKVSSSEEKSQQLRGRGLLFLLKEKDRYGVWYSTQATINVLDALLSLVAGAPSGPDTSIKTEILVNGRVAKTIELPKSQKAEAPVVADISSFISVGSNRVELRRVTGESVASVQVVSTYYVPWTTNRDEADAMARSDDATSLRLSMNFDKNNVKVMEEITCRVKAERVGSRGDGMLLAEIGLPPGVDVDRATLDTAMKNANGSINQYDVLPDRVVFYLWPKAGGSSFSFKFKPRLAMTAKSASSIVYDYYNPEARAVVAPSTFVVVK